MQGYCAAHGESVNLIVPDLMSLITDVFCHLKKIINAYQALVDHGMFSGIMRTHVDDHEAIGQVPSPITVIILQRDALVSDDLEQSSLRGYASMFKARDNQGSR